MKRVLVDCPRARQADGSTGLSPRMSTTSLAHSPLAQKRSSTPRLGACSSPRQSAAIGRGERREEDEDAPELLEPLTAFMLEPPRIPHSSPRSPRAMRSPRRSHTAPMVPPSPFVLEPAVLCSPRAVPSSAAALHSPRGSPRSPAAPSTAVDSEWCTVPTRRSDKRKNSRAAVERLHGADHRHTAIPDAAARPASRSQAQPCGLASGWPDDDDDDGDPCGLLERLSDKAGRNPQGNKSNNFTAVLKREGAVNKRNAQRGGPKR